MVWAVSGEDDAGESGGAAQANGEFSVEAEGCCKLGRQRDSGPSESGHAAYAAGETLEEKRGAADEEEVRHRHGPAVG